MLDWNEYAGYSVINKKDEDEEKKKNEEEEVLEYGSLVGKVCVSRMLLYRAS